MKNKKYQVIFRRRHFTGWPDSVKEVNIYVVLEAEDLIIARHISWVLLTELVTNSHLWERASITEYEGVRNEQSD